MKLKIFLILIIIFLSFSNGLGQKKKSKKDKKALSNVPKLTVVDIKQQPIVIQREPIIIEKISSANGSLFSDAAANVNLLVDFKARRIGDLVFVDVVETSKATVNSSAQRSRDSGTVGGLTTLTGLLPIPGAAEISSVIGGLGNREYEGQGTTQRNSNVQARITARVIEVLPNGDLRIQAVKIVKINKETEQIALTGIVRKKDIAADNSIQTIAIGDLRVEFNGKGIASKENAPGWLSRLFDKINPF